MAKPASLGHGGAHTFAGMKEISPYRYEENFIMTV
jgi:hypothetical protein